MDKYTRSDLESNEKWYNFFDSMPYISLKKGYQFRVIPPEGGVIFRLLILTPSEEEYSIYFDAYDRQATVGNPYFEVLSGNGLWFRAFDINEIIEKIYEQEGDD